MNDQEYVATISQKTAGCWNIIRYPIQRALGHRDSILLEFLVFTVARRVTKGEHDKRWIKVTDNTVLSHLEFGEKDLWAAFRSLDRKGFIKCKRRGHPPRRWIRVISRKITETIQSSSGRRNGTSNPPPEGGSILLGEENWSRNNPPLKGGDIPPKSRVSKNTVCPTADGRTSSENGDWIEMAEKLRTAIDSIRKVPASSTVKKWAEHIRRLHITDKFPVHRIHQVLNWYVKTLRLQGDLIANGNPDFLPIAFSGQSFREKFQRLENAMERLRRPRTNGDTMQQSRLIIHRDKTPPTNGSRHSGVEDFEEAF